MNSLPKEGLVNYVQNQAVDHFCADLIRRLGGRMNMNRHTADAHPDERVREQAKAAAMAYENAIADIVRMLEERQ